MIPQIIAIKQDQPNNFNYKNKILPNNNEMLGELNENKIPYNYANFEQENNILINQNHNYINPNRKILSKTNKIMYQTENMKFKNNTNFQRIIQELQYSNSLLNKKNIALESELELIKNKYNETTTDIDDINKHISLCKENQDKIITDLIDRNNYLESLLTKDNKNNNKYDIKKDEILNNKNNLNLHLFIYKMKNIFSNNMINMEMDEIIKDEDYLSIITNNIIKLNNELEIYKKELERKNLEINKLKKENKILKIKLQKIIYNKKQPFIMSENLSHYNSESIDHSSYKNPKEFNPLKSLTDQRISNLDLEDNYSNKIGKIPIFLDKYKSYSPSPIRNNLINNLTKAPNKRDFKLYNYNINNIQKIQNNQNISFIKRNNEMREKVLNNSRSIGPLKYKTLNDFENDKSNNKYQYPKATLVNQQLEKSKTSLNCLINNVNQLENALKDSQNNIYEDNL